MENGEQLTQLIEKFKQKFVPGDFLGVLAFVIILVIEMVILKAHPPGLKRNKKVERAKELGHVVKAHKIRDLRTLEERTSEPSLARSVYEYEVDGTNTSIISLDMLQIRNSLTCSGSIILRKPFRIFPKSGCGLPIWQSCFQQLLRD